MINICTDSKFTLLILSHISISMRYRSIRKEGSFILYLFFKIRFFGVLFSDKNICSVATFIIVLYIPIKLFMTNM